MTTSDRLLSVLGLFTVERPEWTVEEAASELSLAVSTAYRYFRSLAGSGLIVAFSAGRYVLGPAIIQYDRQMRLHDPLITTSEPVMKRIVQRAPAHSVVLLCRLYRNQVICVHQASSDRPDVTVSYERGRLMPLFKGASSKIILAHLPPRTVKAFYDEHAAEMAQSGLGKTWDEVKQRLRGLRAAGLCITQAELDAGMAGIAAPVFEPEGNVVGSLSVVIAVRDRTQQVVAEISEHVKAASEEIHWALSMLASGHDASTPRSSTAARSLVTTSPKARAAHRVMKTSAAQKRKVKQR